MTFLWAFTAPLAFCETIPQDVWVPIDMGAGGWMNQIMAGPGGTIYANCDLSGTYVSRDRGQSWTCIGSVHGLLETHTCGLGFDPADANVVFIGTERGIYRSADNGATFSKVFNGIYCTDIKISKSNHFIGYATGMSRYDQSDGRVYKTADNGASWTPVTTDLPADNFIFQWLFIDPVNPDVLYGLAGPGRFAGSVRALYKSADGGSRWVEINAAAFNGEIIDFAMNPANPLQMYASCNTRGTFRSDNGGADWTWKTSVSGAVHLKSGDPKTVRLFENWRYSVSSDSGDHWTQGPWWPESMFLPGHQWGGGLNSAQCGDLSSDTYFWRNSCWVWGSFDGSVNIQPLWTTQTAPGSGWWKNRGLKNTCVWDLSISEADPNVIYIGFWDMGIWRSLDHGESWQSCNNTDLTGAWTTTVDNLTKQGCGGNTLTLAADQDRAGVVWATLGGDIGTPQTLYKSGNSGKFDSWVNASAGLASGYEKHGLSVDRNSPVNSRRLFITAEWDVYKSEDDGANWTRVSNGLNCRETQADYFDPKYVYAGGEGGFYRSIDSGASWTKTGLGEMTGIHDIKCDPSHAGWIYTACWGGGKGLYRSRDHGNTWGKLLTDDCLRAVAVDPLNPANLYAGSSSARSAGGYTPNSHGVLFSRDTGNTWTPCNEGLSWLFCYNIEVDPADPSYVFAGCPGLGFQKRRFSDVAPSTRMPPGAPLRDFIVDAFPNPAGNGARLTFPDARSLEIFDVAGKRVFKAASNVPGRLFWDLCTQSGSRAGTGLYFYKTRGRDSRETAGKIVVK